MSKFGYASISEKGTVNGTKGDQTKKEVKVAPYYNFGQTHVLRLKNLARRKKCANIAKKICENDNIGYGQNDRTTLFSQCESINWDSTKIHLIKKCNTDCSEMVTCVLNLSFGKAKFPSYITTHSIADGVLQRIAPKVFKKIKITKNYKQKLSDIVYKVGHVAMVVDL